MFAYRRQSSPSPPGPDYHRKVMTIAKIRDRHGRYIRTLQDVERDRLAAVMRSNGFTYLMIAHELGIDLSNAYRAVDRAMADAKGHEDLVTAKQIELDDLDRRRRLLLAVIRRNEGWNDALVIAASNGLDRVARRRAALLGLDEPTKHVVDVITEDMVDAEIARLEAKLGHTVTPDRNAVTD